MIDTIILSLPRTRVLTVNSPTQGIRDWDLQARSQGYTKFVKNPSPRDKASGKYFPFLTNYNRVGISNVNIQFSAPKLLYKNNIDELGDGQFEDILTALENRLKEMGAIVSREDLKNASVTAVHYSKNITLQNGYTSRYVISELGKINLNKRFDFTRARYINDGLSLCAYTHAHSLVIYDKIADLARGKKKSIDREQTPFQLNLFEKLASANEILRLEVRLSQKQKLNSLFKKLGFQQNPTFADVFASEKSKAVLLHYWDTMVSGNSAALFAYSLTPKDLFKQVLIARPTIKGKAAIYYTGLFLLMREGSGMRELRNLLAKRANDRTWYRMAADLREITADLANLRPREWFGQIQQALLDYKTFRL